MGAVEVSADALFGAQTQRAINNFTIADQPMPAQFINSLGLIKSAAAKANSELGVLNADIATGICDAAERIANGEFNEHFPVSVYQTGSGTSSNMNANEVIALLASKQLQQTVHPNDHVNCSQSSNDVIPTAIHVSAELALNQQLLPKLKNLRDVIDRREQEFVGTIKTGRTHLMDAMPISIAQEMSGWRGQLQQAEDRINDSRSRLRMLAQGGTAVGTGVNAPENFASVFCRHLSALTATKFVPADNFFTAISSQDTALELSGQLNTLAAALMKIANDLRWMNSGPLSGLGEIQLSALQPGSSIMPGKVNPVIPEAVAMAAAQVMGNHTAITVAAQSGNFQLNVMLPLVASNLLNSIDLLAGSCDTLAQKCINDFSLNIEVLAASLANNPILVTALNSEIGYNQAAAIAKRAYQQKRPILDVAKEMTSISDQALQQLLDPTRLI